MDTAVAEFTAGAAWIAHEEQMARTTLAQAERIEQQVVAQSRAQSQQREDSESVQRDLETMNIALELTAAATASRARMALVVAEELRARDVLCGEEASDRTMYAAEERRARVDVATWESERQLLLVREAVQRERAQLALREQLMSVASNEQRERADLQRDEARVHADMVRSEATEAAAIRAAIDAARRDVEELARDEKHERYTIHEDEREARRHILQRRAEVAHDAGVHQQLLHSASGLQLLQAMDTAVAEFTAGAAWIAHEEQMARTTLAQAERIEQQVVAQSRAQSQQREDSESVQRDLETMNIALELTAAATASRARMALVVAEELRARDVLCGEEASDRTMYAAEERRARVDVATWESERQLLLVREAVQRERAQLALREQLMSVASNEQRERADLQRDEARVHADMVRSEATEAAAIRAAIDAARRDVEELARDEKHERYTIHEDEREARRHILQRRAEVAHDAGVHQQLLHSASGLQLLQAMDTAVAEFTAGAAWIAHEEQMARTTLAQAERIEQQVVAQSRAQSQQREDSESVQRDLETMNIALELTAAATASRARMALVVAEELRARDVLCGEEASDRTMYAAEERRARVDVATWESERQLLLVREAVQRERAQLALREQLMSVASNEQRERADLQRDEARVHADMVRSEATEAAAIRAAIDAARRDVEELARDEKHERYTIHEDEREARRHILQRRAEVAHDAGVHQQLLHSASGLQLLQAMDTAVAEFTAGAAWIAHEEQMARTTLAQAERIEQQVVAQSRAQSQQREDSESVQRDLETMNIALELTAAATASRARMALVVAEELRARDVLCGEEASDRTMYAAEERRARVDVATWESERQLLLVREAVQRERAQLALREQLMSVASNEQRERADLQRDEARVHADMVRSEATEAAAIRAAIDAARRDVEELARDEKHERYTIHEDEREARRHILQRRAEVAHDAGVHQQLLHSASGLQLLQAMDTAVAEFTAGAAWIAHEEQMARTTLAQAERIEQQVVAQSRAQSQQREDSESVQRDLETMNIALELTAAATASRARMALVVAEELRARDVLCGEEASDRTMYAAEERRARVDVATWESERQLLLVREAVQRERAQLALREQLMSVASNEQRERADLQRDEARVHADMVRSEATEAAAIRAAIDAARRDVEELARDEKHERYTIHEDEREARRHILQRRAEVAHDAGVHQQLLHSASGLQLLQAMDTAVAEFTAGAAWIAHEEQMARTTLAQAERIEQQVVAQSRAQSQQREDSESVQRDLETMNIALELTAAATASRARMALVVAEELRARDVLCGEEASDRTMYAAEERRARVDVATWESERQLLLVREAVQRERAQLALREQLMSVASNEQRERADLQRDEARVHADMVRSEATEAAAIRAAIDAARRDVEELARDEKHERYTIHEDEREARRHILQRRAEVAHDAGVHQQLLHSASGLQLLQAMDTAVAEFTAGAAWIAHEEQMARTTLAQAERIEQQVVAQSRAQSQQREDSESVQRDLETMNIALELTAAATASRARMALVVAEELRARDVLCGEEASDRTMYAAEERRARVDVATWESERQLLLVREAVQRERAQLALREQLMSVASNEQRERADLQRDEARVHADMVRSEATEAAAIRAAIDAARRDVEELARDEKHERYTIHEDEREARRHILQRRAEVAHDAGVHQQLLHSASGLQLLQAMDTAVAEFTAGAAWIAHEEQMARTTLAQAERIEQQVVAQSRAQSQQREDSESVQRDLETMNIALELTAAATASRARMALVVAEELRARDVLCGEEASDRTMYAAEERRARVDVATWESERQLLLVREAVQRERAQLALREQLMSVASNEQRERADLQRDEARVHADMVRSEATEAAAIRAAIDAARRDVEELARDEKHERYTIHEDEREARRHILQRRAEVAHDAGVHQQLLHSASGLQLLQAMDTAVAEFTAGAAWIAHEEQMARTTLAQAERIEQQVVAQSRAQSQQREDSESVQRDLETMNIALELTAAATASRARMALVVAEELRARDVLCGEEASDRTMYAAEERRARVDVATWESERQLLLVREAVQRERAQLALREQLMSVASNEQRERADLQRDEARVHADMVRSEATEAAAIRAAIDAARRDVEELARDEKHERYTIHEDEREARRHILQRRAEVAHDAGVHQQLLHSASGLQLLQAMDTAVAEFTAGAAWIAHEEQMARTTLAQAERIEQQVVAQSRAQSQQREDSESVQRDLETMNIALELTAAATASRARMALVVAEELRARDVLCGEEASDRTMYAAEERRARVDVATWESERQLLLVREAVQRERAQLALREQLMSVASNEQRERADLQRDEARVHADMVRSEATEAAAIRAAIDAARRDVEELARDEKHERYTIHEDEREARRHILQRRAEVAHDAGVHQQLLHSASGLQLLQAMDTAVAEFTAGAAWIAHEEQMARTTLAQAERIEQQVVAQSRAQSQQREDSESVQRDLETMNIALELTAAATASRARMALVVAEELRARDVLCGEEASDRTMYAAEERRARVDVATWESERQLLLVREAVQRERAQLALREQLMSVASNEQRERADLQRDEARVHADMVRSEATEAAAIRAAIDAARRDVEELARDEKHERYTIHEDEREARRHILQRRAEVAHDAGVHQQLLHSASGLQLLQAMDTAVAEFTAGAAWIAHEEQMARTTLAQAERIEQQVVAQSRAQSQQREDSESVQRDLETMNIALELTAAATASRARMALVVAEELRARDVLCGEEASDRTMYAAEERRARVDVATWESERQLLLVREAVQRERAQLALREQLMSVASNEQRERADLQRDEARVHADMVRSEATEAAAIRAAIDAARRDVEELARDEKHERYTIHEDEREARRHILQRRAEVAHDAGVHQQLLHSASGLQLLQAMDTAVAEFTAGAAWIAHEEQMARTTLAQAERIEQQVVAQSRAQSQQREDSESVQRDLETMNIALELTAAATASRARMALVVAEELRARDVLCGEEASDRTMYAAEERRARVDVATWESERQLLLVREAVQRERAQLALREQLMSVASNEQRERADLQRDEARVHADMVRSEATEAAAIRAAIDAARRDVEELARDEKHERYTIHEDEREARRHILQRRAEVAHDAGVHQQLLHSASGLQLLQAMDTAVAEFTAGAAWIAHEEQMARTTLAQAERIEQQVVAQSRAQSQQREDSESVQRDLETMNIALELTAAATASRARMALVVAEELRARDVLCGEEASDRTMYAAEERRARVDVATWESERQLLLVREAVQRERAQLALREQLMSVASNEQRERADLQRDEARVHADMVRSEATEAAAIRAAIDAARRDVEELARDEKHERYTIHEDEREARRHILQRRAEVAHDAGVHQQLLHSGRLAAAAGHGHGGGGVHRGRRVDRARGADGAHDTCAGGAHRAAGCCTVARTVAAARGQRERAAGPGDNEHCAGADGRGHCVACAHGPCRGGGASRARRAVW
ncbi:hypothetical protein ERJ75_000029900 [Trypanosoma vivax]|nr:hypothetical protein ERJ75_000029900 [Trypanosoma vivax]